MSDYDLRDRAIQFECARQLWELLDGVITPDVVAQIADELWWVDSDDDVLEILEEELMLRGFIGIQVRQISSLILIKMCARLLIRAQDFSGRQ